MAFIILVGARGKGDWKAERYRRQRTVDTSLRQALDIHAFGKRRSENLPFNIVKATLTSPTSSKAVGRSIFRPDVSGKENSSEVIVIDDESDC